MAGYKYRGNVFDAETPLPTRKPKASSGCGTPSGSLAHRRRDEPVCALCKEAYSADQKARRDARKAAS